MLVASIYKLAASFIREHKIKIMEELKNLYSRLLNTINLNVDTFIENKISIFNFAKGDNYDNQILIVGRSVNGWYNIHKHEVLLKQDEILNSIGNDDLNWTIDQWGDTENYNTKKSPFWRLNKKIVDFYFGEDENNFNKIGWTNLYKVSKAEGNNPSVRLCNLQLEIAKEILKEEVRILQPKYIIFNTNFNWAYPFLKDDINIEIKKLPENYYVEAIGSFYESKIIIGQHPQRKPEKEQLDEIIKYLLVRK